MYGSNSDEKIFQEKPVWSVPSRYLPKGWCDTVEGYLREAKKLTTLLIRNRILMKAPYRWFLTVYVDFHQTPQETSAWWNKAKRNLARMGIDALWDREPTRSNKVHYHLLVKNPITEAQLAEIVEASLPPRKLGRWHKSIRAVGKSDWRLLHYIAKAKISGNTKTGRFITDLYAKKRLLFVKKLKIRKIGTIGNFWAKPKSTIWKEIVEHEKRIGDGLAKPKVRAIAKYAHDFLGGAVPLKKIERNFGFFWDSDGVQDWIEQVFGKEYRAAAKDQL